MTNIEVTPQLVISVHEDSTVTGNGRNYTIAVKNSGTIPIIGLLVSQTLPNSSTFVSADLQGYADANTVSWRLNVDVGQSATMHSTMLDSGTQHDATVVTVCVTPSRGQSATCTTAV